MGELHIPTQQLRQQDITQGGKCERLMEICRDLRIKRRNSCRELGHDFLWRQNYRNWTEAVLADLGKGRAGGAAFDFSHVRLTPVQHEVIRCPVIALHGNETLVDCDRDFRNGQVADWSTRREQECPSGQET